MSRRAVVGLCLATAAAYLVYQYISVRKERQWLASTRSKAKSEAPESLETPRNDRANEATASTPGADDSSEAERAEKKVTTAGDAIKAEETGCCGGGSCQATGPDKALYKSFEGPPARAEVQTTETSLKGESVSGPAEAGVPPEGDLEDFRKPIGGLNGVDSWRVLPLIMADGAEPAFPENIRVYVKTFGCSHNMSDSEYMCGLIKRAGYQLVDEPMADFANLDVAVLNSCTVKNPSQDGAVNLANKLHALNKHVVLSGCVVQGDEDLLALAKFSAIGVKKIDKVVEAIEETLKGNRYRNLDSDGTLPSLDLPKVRRNQFIEIIPINTGCLGACTYCKTKQARGVLGSYPMDVLLYRIRAAVSEGVKQIWLTSEDTGAYGIDIGLTLPDLLENIRDLLQEIDPVDEGGRSNESDVDDISSVGMPHRQKYSNVMVRVGMTNPPYILRHLDRLSQVLRSRHFFEFMHIPVQSGSDKVLELMNREYTCAEFEECLDRLRECVPGISLMTDFICGFPYETDEDNLLSVQLLSKYKFPGLNISQFYPRPQTPAAKFKRVPTNIVKARSRMLTNTFLSYETFSPLVGTELPVWFSSLSDKSEHTVGHTKNYIKVLVAKDAALLGKVAVVKFLHATKWHLEGVVLEGALQ